MKSFKTFDFIIQVVLLFLIIVSLFVRDIGIFTPFRYIVAFGLVQIVSILVHLVAGPLPWKETGMRKFHLIGTALVLAAMGVAIFADSNRSPGDHDGMAGLGIMIYATVPAIFLALFYTLITGIEWSKLKKLS